MKTPDIFTGRRLLRLFFIALLCIFTPASAAFGASAARTVRIEVPPVIYVPDGAFTLGEAADIDAPDNIKQQLTRLIMTAKDGVLSRQNVIDAVSSSGVGGVRLELKMQPTVRVERLKGGEAGAVSDPASVVSLSSMVKSLAAWDGDVEVTSVGEVPHGRLVGPASIVPGTVAASLKFRGDDGRERSLAVRMVWTQDAAVAARNIKKNTRISREDIVMRRVKVNKPGAYASKASDVIGRTSRRDISQGTVVPAELLSVPSLVKKGAKVRIVARYGGLTASADGVTLEDGMIGESVRVRRADNKKSVVSAYLVNEKTAEVRAD